MEEDALLMFLVRKESPAGVGQGLSWNALAALMDKEARREGISVVSDYTEVGLLLHYNKFLKPLCESDAGGSSVSQIVSSSRASN
jgi:hypothetical protein